VLYPASGGPGESRPVRITCVRCSAEVTASAAANPDVRQFDRDATEFNPAAHIIMESTVGGSYLLHRCLIDVQPDSPT
jgi:hypothetical protein